jgi:hypothetical protein
MEIANPNNHAPEIIARLASAERDGSLYLACALRLPRGRSRGDSLTVTHPDEQRTRHG